MHFVYILKSSNYKRKELLNFFVAANKTFLMTFLDCVFKYPGVADICGCDNYLFGLT